MIRSLIAIAALVAPLIAALIGTVSSSSNAEASYFFDPENTYLMIDKTTMDYSWMVFDPEKSKRIGWVKFTRAGTDPRYVGRRYLGKSPNVRGFPASFSTEYFIVQDWDREYSVMEGTIDGDRIDGYFYDSSGRTRGEFTATKDFKSDQRIFQVCSQDGVHFYCKDMADRLSTNCPVKYFRSFRGKFTHLDEELCATEIERVKNK